MFIIVPKRNKRDPKSTPGKETSAPSGGLAPNGGIAGEISHVEATPRTTDDLVNDRGPVRSSMACDACRMRKTKCNGKEPCNRCRKRQIICVYSRPHNKDLPASPSYVSLLQHQQRRLYTAVQQMASVIASLKGESECAPELFNVPQLLEEYAPDHVIPDSPATDSLPSLAGTKRGHGDASSHTAPKRSRGDEGSPPHSLPVQPGNAISSYDGPSKPEPPFEIHLAPGAQNSGIRDWTESYGTMMQFLQSMNDMATPGGGATASLMGNISHPTSTSLEAQARPAAVQPSTQQFLDLVDWDASLQFLQDSYEFP